MSQGEGALKDRLSSGMKGRSVFQLGDVQKVYNYMSLVSGISRDKRRRGKD